MQCVHSFRTHQVILLLPLFHQAIPYTAASHQLILCTSVPYCTYHSTAASHQLLLYHTVPYHYTAASHQLILLMSILPPLIHTYHLYSIVLLFLLPTESAAVWFSHLPFYCCLILFSLSVCRCSVIVVQSQSQRKVQWILWSSVEMTLTLVGE